MAQSLRQLKSRIKGVESTRKLTRAMEMVSSSKLKRTQKLREAASRYFVHSRRLLVNIVSGRGDIIHPFFKAYPAQKKLGLVVVTSDTGLCGSYNISVLRFAEQFLKEYASEDVTLIVVGRKGISYFKRRGIVPFQTFSGYNGRFSDELCAQLVAMATDLFSSGKAREVYTVYAKMEGAARQKPVAEKFLPLVSVGKPVEYIPESGEESVVAGLLPLYVESKMRLVLLEAFVSEHQTRVVAMGEATKNAVELFEKLVLMRNKLRQASITKDILEVVSSAEALKG